MYNSTPFGVLLYICGGCRIRTYEGFRPPVFKTGALNHSANPPIKLIAFVVPGPLFRARPFLQAFGMGPLGQPSNKTDGLYQQKRRSSSSIASLIHATQRANAICNRRMCHEEFRKPRERIFPFKRVYQKKMCRCVVCVLERRAVSANLL